MNWSVPKLACIGSHWGVEKNINVFAVAINQYNRSNENHAKPIIQSGQSNQQSVTERVTTALQSP